MTKKALLLRGPSTAQGTFGELWVGKVKFVSGELPWNKNEPLTSCIPAGTYACDWVFSAKFKRKTYLLFGVPSRTEIRIHPANLFGDGKKYRSEVEGCISLGRMMGQMNGQTALLRSRQAVEHFEQIMGGACFTLEIRDTAASLTVL